MSPISVFCRGKKTSLENGIDRVSVQSTVGVYAPCSMGEDVSQLTLANRHRGARFEGLPQAFLGRARVVSRHVVVVLVEAPGRRGISPGRSPDLLGLHAESKLIEEGLGKTAQGRVALANRLLAPPGDAATGEDQAEAFFEGAKLPREIPVDRHAQPVREVDVERLAIEATAHDLP